MRPFWILILLILAAAAVGAYYAVSWPGFYPHRVSVTGNKMVPAEVLRSRADVSLRRNVWLLNVRAACERVKSIPYVASCAILRTPLANVWVRISERRPFANVVGNDGAALVDDRLRVLESSPQAGLPQLVARSFRVPHPGAFIRDATIQRLRSDYAQLSEGRVIARALRLDEFGQLDVTLNGGIAVHFGDERNLARTIPLVGPILAQVSGRGRPIRAIDLRAPGTPVVEYRK